MKSPFANEVEPNRVITTSFLVHSKEIRQKKSGEMYLSLLLGDRTGELDAKMWDNVAEVIDGFDRDDFVKVKGLIQVFHNRPQLTIHKLRRMDESEIEIVDYFPSSRRDPEEMWRELRGVVDGIAHPHLKALLEALFGDEDIAQRYRRAPAAKHIHHAFLGGLIEHVLSLCGLARMAANHYRNIDCDLLLTGVLLHDIGKIYELNYERGFSYSSEGQLLGHMQIGLRMVAEKLRGLQDFPPQLRMLVEHMILSHHGQLEFGSPKVPLFPEALLLHYLDDMDSKLECMRAMIDNDRQLEGCFTSYNSAMARTALKKDRLLNPEVPRPPAAAAASNGTMRPAKQPGPTPLPAGAVQSSGSAAPPPAEQHPGPPAPPSAAAQQPEPPAPPAAAAQHPLFARPSASPFADKLKQALASPPAEQKG